MYVRARIHNILYSILLILLQSCFPGDAFAQQSPEKRLFHDFLQDQKAIWTSPAHINKHDLKWLLPFTIAAAGLIITDTHNSGVLVGGDNDDLSLNHGVANAGLGMLTGGLALSYVAGHLRNDSHSVQTGALGAEAIADSAFVGTLLKFATNRRRPNTPGADGDFWSGGKSFPSEHSIMAWAGASVIARRYSDRPLLKWSAYSMAAAVSMTRVTGKNHYPSDIAAGALFGYLIGRYVVRHHGNP